jgi:hypothetical protein
VQATVGNGTQEGLAVEHGVGIVRALLLDHSTH